MSKTLIEASHINKYFHDPETFKVLNDITFAINEGEFVSVIGKSGCGKSTLLYILSTMDTDFEGDLLIDGESMKTKKEKHINNGQENKKKKTFRILMYFAKKKNLLLENIFVANDGFDQSTLIEFAVLL